MEFKRQFLLEQDAAAAVKKALTAALRELPCFALLDSCGYYTEDVLRSSAHLHHKYRFIMAAAPASTRCNDERTVFESAISKAKASGNWLFGYFGYDLRQQVEEMPAENPDHLGFDDYFFFIPEVMISCEAGGLLVIEAAGEQLLQRILSIIEETIRNGWHEGGKPPFPAFKVSARFTKAEYLHRVSKVLSHIHRGDIYEMNFCQEFFCENAAVDPHLLWERINAASPMPFSFFIRNHRQYMIGASPERFLMKEGNVLRSQPMKGTIRRSGNAADDDLLRRQLQDDPKEQSENVMIVDLVRNDLSRVAAPGSVTADELFGVHPFPNIFQMISTVSATLSEHSNGGEAIRSAFPMGSMTGAPKVRAMQLIEAYEAVKRGPFSGAAGYICPSGDFDLNVMIRTIFYNAEKKYLSFSVGGAITAASDPQSEYEECLLKAMPMFKVLESQAL